MDGLRQVWCVAYDDEQPGMSGQRQRIRMGEWETKASAESSMRTVRDHSPWRAEMGNLGVESRWVSEWEED